MASRSGVCFSALLFLLVWPGHSAADTLRITSKPAGATVEINGVIEGATPFEKDYPGGYFHKIRTSMGARLEHGMVARVSLAGYVTKEICLTEGPMNWISLNGRNRGEYWLLKSDHGTASRRTGVYRSYHSETIECCERGSGARGFCGGTRAPNQTSRCLFERRG